MLCPSVVRECQGHAPLEPARRQGDQLLAGISPDARREIVAGSRRLTLRPAQVLFRTGEPAEQLFVLRRGGCSSPAWLAPAAKS